MVANDAVKESRLPGAIGANQTNDLALIDLKGDVVVGHNATKILDKIDHLKKGQV
jgi:hypothetical protein